jgi:hypothetical protein
MFAQLRRHETRMAAHKRIPAAFIVVGSAFAAIGVGLLCGAIFILLYHSGGSTLLMALLAFGWAFLAMVGSMLLALPGKVDSDRMRIDRGTVTVDTGRGIQGSPTTITGPGIAAEVEAEIAVTNNRPSMFLFAAAFGLAALTTYLYLAGRTTPVGVFFSLGIAFFIGNWAKQARPPREKR